MVHALKRQPLNLKSSLGIFRELVHMTKGFDVIVSAVLRWPSCDVIRQSLNIIEIMLRKQSEFIVERHGFCFIRQKSISLKSFFRP